MCQDFCVQFISFQFDKAISDHEKLLLAAERHFPHELPVNVMELLHFPDRSMMAEDPEQVFDRLLTKGAKHHIPIVHLAATWEMMQDVYEYFTGSRPLGFQSLRERLLNSLPSCKLHYTVVNKRTGQRRYVEGSAFKKKTYPADKYESIVCETRSNLKELLSYHAALHKGDTRQELESCLRRKDPMFISVYIDGVKATSTGSWKMLCQVIRHDCCNLMLSYSTFVYARDYELTNEEILAGLLADLNKHRNIHISLLVADMPERSRLCGLTSHNGDHGCLICVSPGEKREGAPGTIWPFWTTTSVLRDHESFINFARATITAGLTVGGQKRPTPLVHFPGFSIVDNVCIEPMHLFAGLSKYFWEKISSMYLTTKEMAHMHETVSKVYCELPWPTGMKRAPRKIDVANFRANEWKQLIALCGLDIGLEFCRAAFPEVGKLWHRYTYILRMLAQGDEWYQFSSYTGALVRAEITLLYKDVERLLGKNCCVPNLHALSHLPDWRDKASLSDMSAEKAEDFYGQLKKSFSESTMSVGKQAHYNTLLAMREGHVCKKGFKFSPRSKARDMDHIMIDRQRNCWYYEATQDEEGFYSVRKIHVVSHYTEVTDMHWGDAGILRVLGTDEDVTLISKDEIIAKGIINNENLLFVWTQDLQDF